MGMYVKGYTQRATMIIATVVIVLVSSLLCYGLFKGKLNNVSGQLNSYASSDYSILYLLNYGDGFDNECLFPDTDIQFYLDAGKNQRLTVSSVMREDGVSYGLDYLTPVSRLNANEICVSKNAAKTYNLHIGDVIYAEYPYMSDLVPTKVVEIAGTEYDYQHPYIDNNIGVVFLGFDTQYSTSTNGKYLLFASESQAEMLSEYPQIIDAVINKSVNVDKVSSQGAAAILFSILFAVAAIIIVQIVFFSKSGALLYRCYLKGMKRSQMIWIPFFERIIFCLLPCAIFQSLAVNSLPGSTLTTAYKVVPTLICGVFCLVMLLNDFRRLRKRGG